MDKQVASCGGRVVVVDYGASNLKSIVRGLERAGARVEVARAAAEMAGAAGLVLPGVGAAGAAMQGLRARRLVAPLRAAIEQGTPFLGVCLGMQLLFGPQEEDDATGLALLPGRVRRLRGVKVPHMGWNTVEPVRRNGTPAAVSPLAGLPPRPYVYFVHSYHVEVETGSEEIIAGTAEYGGVFVSALARGNVWGTQFHPEKSGEVGGQVLRNFVARCTGSAGIAHTVVTGTNAMDAGERTGAGLVP